MDLTTPRPLLRILAAACAAALPATAQGPTFAVTTTQPLGVFADAPQHAPDVQVLPARSAVAPGFRLAAQSGRSSASFELAVAPTSARFTIRGRAASPQGPTHAGTCIDPTPTQGPVGLEVLLTTPVATACRLVVELSGQSHTAQPTDTSHATLAVRVGNSGGAWDTGRVTPLRLDLGVTVDPTGVPVQIDMAGLLAATDADYEATVALSLVAEPTMTAYGQSCATLTGRAFGSSLSLQVHSGIQRGAAALLFGTRPVQQPLPWSGCSLLVDPMVALGGYRTGIDGIANISLRLPPGALDLHLQGVAFDPAGGAVETTDGAIVVVPF